jgi:hypothetical protein
VRVAIFSFKYPQSDFPSFLIASEKALGNALTDYSQNSVAMAIGRKCLEQASKPGQRDIMLSPCYAVITDRYAVARLMAR